MAGLDLNGGVAEAEIGAEPVRQLLHQVLGIL
jgi:hypothetical protein